MGVLELFGVLSKDSVTSSAILKNYVNKLNINHFFIDFNSIIHVAAVKVDEKLNNLLLNILNELAQTNQLNNDMINELNELKINPDIIINLYNNTKMEIEKDKLQLCAKYIKNQLIKNNEITYYLKVINQTILDFIEMTKTYIEPENLKTLFIALDGVPSKAKIMESKHRRYMGYIFTRKKREIFKKYKDYLKKLNKKEFIGNSLNANVYYAFEKNKFSVDRAIITPGTRFMHELSKCLKKKTIEQEMKKIFPNLKTLIISDVYDVGEGEKKITNYLDTFHKNNNKDTYLFYSPDGDVILLSLIQTQKHMKMLRFNQQTKENDLIDIEMLQNNIINSMDFGTRQIEPQRIIDDIVCLFSLFGNDFIKKIETINVDSGFHELRRVYEKIMSKYKDNDMYLVKYDKTNKTLNFLLLKQIFNELEKYEQKFFENIHTYNKHKDYGMLKYVFDYAELNSKNIQPIFNDFKKTYDNLTNHIKQGFQTEKFTLDDNFMASLKKSIEYDGYLVNELSKNNFQGNVVDYIKEYYEKNNKFPKLGLKNRIISNKSSAYHHINNLKDKNDYEKELYKMDKMLDEYAIEFNAGTINENDYKNFYNKFFMVDKKIVVHDYVEGLMWVFNSYYNNKNHLNTWFYKHSRSPLIKDISKYLNKLTNTEFHNINNNLIKYNVSDKNIEKYFHPFEQFIYMSPINENSYLISNELKEKIMNDKENYKRFYMDLDKMVKKNKLKYDCLNIPFFNKCNITNLPHLDSKDDEDFLKWFRKIDICDYKKYNKMSVKY